jgi:hypothetical protein
VQSGNTDALRHLAPELPVLVPAYNEFRNLVTIRRTIFSD